MRKVIGVGSGMGKRFRLLTAIILMVSLGRPFEAGGQTFTIIHSFGSVPNDGAYPGAGLTLGSDGNLYGVTILGGLSNYGTVFRFNPIDPMGSYTNLCSLSSATPDDGLTGHAGLVQGSDGNLYGTTQNGGTNGVGTVFRISQGGSYTTLYTFRNARSDGAVPHAGLLQASDGNLYGTTAFGGTDGPGCGGACGTVFRISPEGNYTNLHFFAGTDGYSPLGVLVQGSDGYLYGTTFGGGAWGAGTVFKMSLSGTLTTIYSFGVHSVDSYWPSAGLARGSDGNFYGTAAYGTTNGGGSVFRITPSGVETDLYVYGSHPNDGGRPLAGLLLGSDGNLYGTTSEGGANNEGTVFRISLSGSYTNLYSFKDQTIFVIDGDTPTAGLVQAPDGNFYGTTLHGGVSKSGIVYRLSIPLNPPANQIAAVQLSGTNVIVSIPSIAGATYQLQFGGSMSSPIWSNVPDVSISNSIGAMLTLTNCGGAAGPQGFYRFLITP